MDADNRNDISNDVNFAPVTLQSNSPNKNYEKSLEVQNSESVLCDALIDSDGTQLTVSIDLEQASGSVGDSTVATLGGSLKADLTVESVIDKNPSKSKGTAKSNARKRKSIVSIKSSDEGQVSESEVMRVSPSPSPENVIGEGRLPTTGAGNDEASAMESPLTVELTSVPLITPDSQSDDQSSTDAHTDATIEVVSGRPQRTRKPVIRSEPAAFTSSTGGSSSKSKAKKAVKETTSSSAAAAVSTNATTSLISLDEDEDGTPIALGAIGESSALGPTATPSPAVPISAPEVVEPVLSAEAVVKINCCKERMQTLATELRALEM